jgi:hypothetical protein
LILFLAASPLFVFAVHIPFSRMIKKCPPQIVAGVAILFSQCLLVILLKVLVLPDESLSPLELASLWAYSLTVLFSLAYSYFHFFNTSETARRIRILHEIASHGTLTESEIRGIYKGEDIVDTRLTRLLALKQLSYDGERYYLKGRVLYYSAISIALWRKVLETKTPPRKSRL